MRSSWVRILHKRQLENALRNFEKVKASKFDAPRLAYPSRHVARTLGACIVDDPEAESRITSLLQDQDEDRRVRDSTRISSVVIEAALAWRHNVLSVQHQTGDLCKYCGEARAQFTLRSNLKQPVCESD